MHRRRSLNATRVQKQIKRWVINWNVLILHVFYLIVVIISLSSPILVLQQCIPTLPTWAWPDPVQYRKLWPVHHTWPSRVGQWEGLHHGDLIHWGWPGQSLCDPAGRGRDRSGPLCVSCFHHCVSDLNVSALFCNPPKSFFFKMENEKWKNISIHAYILNERYWSVSVSIYRLRMAVTTSPLCLCHRRGCSDESSCCEASLGRGAPAQAVAEWWRQSGRRPREFHSAVWGRTPQRDHGPAHPAGLHTSVLDAALDVNSP